MCPIYKVGGKPLIHSNLNYTASQTIQEELMRAKRVSKAAVRSRRSGPELAAWRRWLVILTRALPVLC